MIRRRFLQLIAAAGAGSLATAGVLEAGETKTVAYRIVGFTCVTCAVGLEVMLKQKRGVSWASANYPDATARIKYHPAIVSEESLRAFITEMGFSAKSADLG